MPELDSKEPLVSGLTRRDVLRVAVVTAGGAVAAAAAPASLLRPAAAGTTDYTIALTHVTVIDATGAPPRHDMTVLIQGQRIVAVGHRGDIPIPPGVEILELPGRFVIPGLCDMHVHSVHGERIALPLYIANGVTTVREMAGSSLFHEWRDRVESGSLRGPRWVIGSRIIDGAPTIGDPASFIEVGNEEEARRAVRQAKREGADFVKVYSRLSGEAYRAIADEARLQQIPFAGHCPDAVPLTHASPAGQRSIEHLFSTWYETSTQEAEIRRAIADLRSSRVTTSPGSTGSIGWSGPRPTATAMRRRQGPSPVWLATTPDRSPPSPCTGYWTDQTRSHAPTSG
jgi:hypothetical protein